MFVTSVSEMHQWRSGKLLCQVLLYVSFVLENITRFWKSQSEWQRTGINGESTSMVWPTLGSRTAKEQELGF